MLPSATPLAQCFIELLQETAANQGFFKTDLETILLSFFFGGLGSSPLCQVNPSGKMLGLSNAHQGTNSNSGSIVGGAGPVSF